MLGVESPDDMPIGEAEAAANAIIAQWENQHQAEAREAAALITDAGPED
jgi:hypothetical protein